MVWLLFGNTLGIIGAILNSQGHRSDQGVIGVFWLYFVGVFGFVLIGAIICHIIRVRVTQYQWVLGMPVTHKLAYLGPFITRVITLVGGMAFFFGLIGIIFHTQMQIEDIQDQFISLVTTTGSELIQDSLELKVESEPDFIFKSPTGLESAYWLSSGQLAVSVHRALQPLPEIDYSAPIQPVLPSVHQIILGRFRSLSRSEFLDPGGFLSALLLGNRGDLDPRIMIYFRQAGLLHILALSGFHLGLILGLGSQVSRWYNRLIPWLAKKDFLPSHWVTQWVEHLGRWLVLGFCLGYCLIAIPGPGLYRAALMAGCIQLAKIFKIRLHFWHGYWLSMMLLLLFDPGYLFHWGFLLSYLALFGLVWAAKPLEVLMSPFLGKFLAWYGSTGIAAVWATIPFFLATTFESQGLAINGIFVGPLMGWVVTLWAILGALWLILPLPLIDQILGYGGQITYQLLIQARVVPPFRGIPLVLFSFWLAMGVLIGVYQYWYSGRNDNRLRLPSVSTQFPGTPGLLNEKTVWPKLYDQPQGPGKNSFLGNPKSWFNNSTFEQPDS